MRDGTKRKTSRRARWNAKEALFGTEECSLTRVRRGLVVTGFYNRGKDEGIICRIKAAPPNKRLSNSLQVWERERESQRYYDRTARRRVAANSLGTEKSNIFFCIWFRGNSRCPGNRVARTPHAEYDFAQSIILQRCTLLVYIGVRTTRVRMLWQ